MSTTIAGYRDFAGITGNSSAGEEADTAHRIADLLEHPAPNRDSSVTAPAMRDVIHALSPQQLQGFVAGLSDSALQQLGSLAAGGLSISERKDLFHAMAGSLNAAQLGRVAASLSTSEDREAFASTVANFAPASVAASLTPSTERTDTRSPLVSGLGGAAGREQFIRAQINQAIQDAASHPATRFDGDLYRAVPTSRYATYADHTWSAPGRYNLPGQSALYTAPSLADVQAESANYSGLDGNSVVRSHFDGELLDLRSLEHVTPGALTEPYGSAGSHRSALSRLTGEDPYSIPRAVADQARLRGLNGVIAPANQGNSNVALFPDDPNAPTSGSGRLQHGLTYLDQQDFRGTASSGSYRATSVNAPPPDATPNRSSPAASPATYGEKVSADAELHGRAGGARYGAAGAGIVTLIDDARTGHFDAGDLAVNMGGGAVIGQADSMLSRAIERSISPAMPPPNVAGSALADAGVSEAGAATRAVSLAAGATSAGIIGGVVAGGASVWTQADAVKDHQLAAGQATANAVVDTGVGFGSGAAGAAAGAAVGSIVPVAGTAVGAVVGFGVGLGVSYLAQHSGLASDAKQELGKVLTDHFEQPLQHAWDEAAKGVDEVKSAAGSVAQGAKSAMDKVEGAASSAWHAATSWL